MNRRELVLLLGSVIIVPRRSRAQQKAMPVIGFLGSTSPGPYAAHVAAFHQGLNETGYVEGLNVAIEYRWAEGDYESAARIGRRARRPQGRYHRCRQRHFGACCEKCDRNNPDRLHQRWRSGLRLWRPRLSRVLLDVSNGSWAAVRHNARMLQHCLSKQTLCRRDCRPLECQLPTSGDLP
jgi:hypothetical protein